MALFPSIINKVLCSKNTFLHTLQDNIATVLHEENDKSTIDIDNKLDELQKELLRLANSKADYNNFADEIYRLRELKHNTLVQHAECQGKRQRIAEMAEFLKEQSIELLEYDEQLVRRLVEKVTVFEDYLEVEFKSVLCMRLEYKQSMAVSRGEQHLGWRPFFASRTIIYN